LNEEKQNGVDIEEQPTNVEIPKTLQPEPQKQIFPEPQKPIDFQKLIDLPTNTSLNDTEMPPLSAGFVPPISPTMVPSQNPSQIASPVKARVSSSPRGFSSPARLKPVKFIPFFSFCRPIRFDFFWIR
jgi:hypothetical protein